MMTSMIVSRTALLCLLCMLFLVHQTGAADREGLRSRVDGNGGAEDKADGQKHEFTKEHAIKFHNDRKQKMRNMLDKTRAKIEAHEDGSEPLESDEHHDRMQQRLKSFERRFEMMDRELDEKDLERIMERKNRRRSFGTEL